MCSIFSLYRNNLIYIFFIKWIICIKIRGIIIPDSAKEKPSEAKVVALGTGKSDEDGKKVAFEVKVGDVVLVSKYGGTEIKVDGKEYKILNADDILAVLA